jgi:hypothetical protein
MTDFPKTSYRFEIGLKYDAIPTSAVSRLVRESVGPDKLFLNVGKDPQSGETWLWKGDGTEENPYYWIKISPSRILVFSGFYSGWKAWQEFRQKCSNALANSLPEVTHEALAYINTTLLWQVATEDIKSPEKASSELLPYFYKFLPANLDSIDRIGIGLYNESKRRASLDMYIDQASKEIQFLAVIQENKFDLKKTILQIIGQVFGDTDQDLLKANSSVLDIIG